jgi:hypothetical protein
LSIIVNLLFKKFSQPTASLVSDQSVGVAGARTKLAPALAGEQLFFDKEWLTKQ